MSGGDVWARPPAFLPQCKLCIFSSLSLIKFKFRSKNLKSFQPRYVWSLLFAILDGTYVRYLKYTSFYRQKIWLYIELRLQKRWNGSPVSVVQLTCDCMHNRGGAAGGSLICRIYTAPSLNPLAWILELQTKVREDFTMTEKAPTRAFSWLKSPTSTFTFKTHSDTMLS